MEKIILYDDNAPIEIVNLEDVVYEINNKLAWESIDNQSNKVVFLIDIK